jgi:hypothetical protein
MGILEMMKPMMARGKRGSWKMEDGRVEDGERRGTNAQHPTLNFQRSIGKGGMRKG